LNRHQRASAGRRFQGGQLKDITEHGQLIALQINVLETIQRPQRARLHRGNGVVLQMQLEERRKWRENATFYFRYMIILQSQLAQLMQFKKCARL